VKAFSHVVVASGFDQNLVTLSTMLLNRFICKLISFIAKKLCALIQNLNQNYLIDELQKNIRVLARKIIKNGYEFNTRHFDIKLFSDLELVFELYKILSWILFIFVLQIFSTKFHLRNMDFERPYLEIKILKIKNFFKRY